MVLIPFVFAACTITLTLTVLYAIALHFSMVSYVTNLVELIGLGLAVDYSLLIVSRYREELDRGRYDGRGDRADDGDRGTRRRLLGDDRRDRAGAAAARARSVHPVDRRRRLPRAARVDRGGGDAAAGAALVRRAPRRAPRAGGRVPPLAARDPAAGAAGDGRRRERLLGAAGAVDHAPTRSVPRRRDRDPPRLRGAGDLPSRHARLDLGAAAVPGVGARPEAPARGRGRRRADADGDRRRRGSRRCSARQDRARGDRAARRRAVPRSGGLRRRARPRVTVRRARAGATRA